MDESHRNEQSEPDTEYLLYDISFTSSSKGRQKEPVAIEVDECYHRGWKWPKGSVSEASGSWK